MPSETDKVAAMVARSIRYERIVESHKAVVHALGMETLRKAYDEASAALKPKTGKEIIYPPIGYDMDDYYRQFDAVVDSEANTPFEHIYIALVAAGLLTVMMACEYSTLSEEGKAEFAKRSHAYVMEEYNTQPVQGAYMPIENLPDLPPIAPNVKLEKLGSAQVNSLLKDFSKLYQKTLLDEDDDECYKVIGVNYSPTGAGIESYEVQFQDCPSAVTVPSEDVKEMLERSAHVVP